MKEKSDGKLTVQVVSAIPKTLNSRDSAERLVRTAVGLWRARSDGHNKNTTTLVLDFEGITQMSESAASALVEFRLDFSEDKYPAMEFSNMSDSVKKTFAAVEKPVQRIHKRISAQAKKKNSFMIEI